jgi:hypothetical protein
MKKYVLILRFLFFSVVTFGQKNEFNLIKLDTTWGQEVLRFPGRNINYTGVAEIRFPPIGWIHPEHAFFWSYTYAWSIDLNRKITSKELETDLVKYFNSLNKVAINDKTNKRKASATITEIKTKNSTTFFEGKIATYDRFATNKRFTLNVKIKSHFCKNLKKTVLLFTFSPKECTHEVWETLNNINLVDGVCGE